MKEETLRRGRLQIRFGLFSGFMALIYSGLLFLLGHHLGGIIFGVAGLAITQVPWIVRRTGNLALSGHLYGGTILLAITSLCVIDGGKESPMFLWMASVPICALMLMNLREAIWWGAVCLATSMALIYLDMKGVVFPTFFPKYLNSAVGSASGFGLIIYMTFLALLFEKSRLEATLRLQHASEQLSLANQELINLNRQKNEFLNIAAHDLKNPLSIICGYADLLREIESPTLEDIQDQASEILRSGTHMLGVIRNILDVREIEDGHRELSKEECSLHQIVSDSVSGFENLASRKQIDIINEVSSETHSSWADPGATRQILDNLISNAVIYTPELGVVRITAEHTEEEVIINITDTGPGLSQEDQDLLWSKFTRLTPRPTGKEHSTGLGLWIARKLATGMGGNTFCISKLGQGSTFGAQLPVWTPNRRTILVKNREPGDQPEKAAFDRLIADIKGTSGEEGSTDIALPN
ncbi:MAG: HAMP domain-containing sensor histidine kinase [Verrucomicrobiales bacterium]|nr:HAMP domain-containing sensor histidine kinase [Verrucomicrobiales bacterium]